jgi:hypothetical protein
MEWAALTQGFFVAHAGNGREKQIAGKWKVDGYVDEEDRIIEFLGIFF